MRGPSPTKTAQQTRIIKHFLANPPFDIDKSSILAVANGYLRADTRELCKGYPHWHTR